MDNRHISAHLAANPHEIGILVNRTDFERRNYHPRRRPSEKFIQERITPVKVTMGPKILHPFKWKPNTVFRIEVKMTKQGDDRYMLIRACGDSVSGNYPAIRMTESAVTQWVAEGWTKHRYFRDNPPPPIGYVDAEKCVVKEGLVLVPLETHLGFTIVKDWPE